MIRLVKMSLGQSLTLALVLAIAPLAQADLVHLNTGGVVKGEIIAETPEEVKIKTAGGITTIFREDIERIERNKDAGSVYKESLAKIDPKDADAHYRLGKEMKKLRLDKEAKECFEKALKIDPNHLPAKIALAEGAARANELIAVADEKEQDGAPLASPIVVRGKVPPELQKALEAVKKGVRDQDAEKRAAAFAKAQELFLAHMGTEARYAVLATLLGVEAESRKTYEKAVRGISSAISDYEKADQRKARDRYLAAWERSKKEALDVIFDLKIYPDENHGKVGQPKVDEKVDVVKKVYPTYEALILGDIAKFRGLSEAQAAKLASTVEQAGARLSLSLATIETLYVADDFATDETVPERAPPALKDVPAAPPAAPWALLLYRAGRIDDAYAVKERLSPWEVRLLERMRDMRVEDWNEVVWKDPAAPAKGKRPNNEERQQVRITNNYRIMMGRPALEIHTCLVESARGHSQEMTQLGYFEHDSPVPANRTPSDRAKNAGYEGGAAENISLGSVSPQATHDAWYNSSGHHRNILGDHLAMGSGLDGQHWTQNFGGHGVLLR